MKMSLRLNGEQGSAELQEVERTEKGRVVIWKIVSSSLLIFEGTGSGSHCLDSKSWLSL